jgi:hypothetical protein
LPLQNGHSASPLSPAAALPPEKGGEVLKLAFVVKTVTIPRASRGHP